MTRPDIDVLVAGAGPVGLTLANALSRHGATFRIIDKSPAPSDKSKALVLWSRSLEMLQDLDAVEPFLAAGLRVRGATIFGEGRRLAHVPFHIESPFDFALMLPQSETERLLHARLEGAGARVERKVELTAFGEDESGVVSTLRLADGSLETVRSRWLAGCDGAHSAVRHGLGVDFLGAAEPNDWILADVHLQGDLPADELSIYFHPAGVVVFFPITPTRFRIVADAGASASGPPKDPSLEDVARIAGERGPGGLTLSDPVWLAAFRINERKVARYRHGRVFLAGDAAHVHSPAGGQGMNTGMQDAYNLAWKLGLAARERGRDILLESYTAERSAVGEVVLRNAAFMTRAATLRNSVAQTLRNHLYAFLTSLESVQHRIGDTLSELSIHYRQSPIVGGDRGPGVAPGERAPDGRLVDGATLEATTLFEAFRGTRHRVLHFMGLARAAAPPELTRVLTSLDPALFAAHRIVPGRFPPPDLAADVPILFDPEGAVHRRYGASEPTVFLVRPDGYVGFRCRPAEVDGLLRHLSSYIVDPQGGPA